MSLDNDRDTEDSLRREAEARRDVSDAIDSQKNAYSELKTVLKELSEALETVNSAIQSVFSAMNVFATAIMAVISLVTKSGGVSKELAEAVDNLSRSYLVLQQIVKATSTSVEKYMELSMKVQQQLKEQIEGATKYGTSLKEVEDVFKSVNQLYSSSIKLYDTVLNVQMGFVDENLKVIESQIGVYRAQREYNQALAMYRMIVARYGKDSEQARRAQEALNYSSLKLRQSQKQVAVSQQELSLVWLKTVGIFGQNVLSIIGAITVLGKFGNILKSVSTFSNIFSRIVTGLSVVFSKIGAVVRTIGGLFTGFGRTILSTATSFAPLLGVIAMVVGAFGAVGFAVENLYGGYEAVKEKNRELIESSSELMKGVFQFGDAILDFAQTLPPGLKEVAEGISVVIMGWAGIFDTGIKLIGGAFDWLAEKFSSVSPVIETVFRELGSFITTMLINPFQALQNLISSLINIFVSLGNQIQDTMRPIVGVLKPVTDVLGGAAGIFDIGRWFGGGRQVGGEVERGGLYYLHPGEIVTRRGFEGNRITNVSPTINVNMTFNVSSEVDIVRVREEIQRVITDAVHKGLLVRGVLGAP